MSGFPNQKFTELIRSGNATLAVEKDGELVWSVFGRGIGPALEGLDSHAEELKNAAVYDLIIGKAAASVFACAGVASVYGDTISDSAVTLLESRGIRVAWRVRTEQIINRLGTGLCPFEQRVLDIASPEACIPEIRALHAELKRKSQQP